MRMTTRIAKPASVRTPADLIARIAGAFYLLKIVTGLDFYCGPRNRREFLAEFVAADSELFRIL
jgi:hypothetical protein